MLFSAATFIFKLYFPVPDGAVEGQAKYKFRKPYPHAPLPKGKEIVGKYIKQ